jgi:hypothetical protein
MERFPDSYIPSNNHQFINYLKDYYSRGTYNDLSEKNNFRMAPYHRLDLGIQFHKMKKWGERTWEISIYNAYNRKNPFYYYTTSKITQGWAYDGPRRYKASWQEGILKQVSLFPIIPSVTYSFKF